MRTVPLGSFISIVPTADGADILPTRLHFLSGMSETVTGRSLLLLPSRPSRYLLRQAKTWLALIACRCATRATDAPAPKVSSTIRRFSSIDSPSPLYLSNRLNRPLLGSVHLSPRGHLSMCPLGQLPYLLSFRPDGSDQSLTANPQGGDVKLPSPEAN
jgi:hypothetical protein